MDQLFDEDDPDGAEFMDRQLRDRALERCSLGRDGRLLWVLLQGTPKAGGQLIHEGSGVPPSPAARNDARPHEMTKVELRPFLRPW